MTQPLESESKDDTTTRKPVQKAHLFIEPNSRELESESEIKDYPNLDH